MKMNMHSQGYRIIEDIKAYVDGYLQDGEKIILAEKSAKIQARPGVKGEEIISWSVDSNGKELIEREAVVTNGIESKEPQWVATKLDQEGNVLVDQNGHINQWVISNAVFQKKYEKDLKQDGIYKPKGGIQKFLRLKEAIQIPQWGSVYQVDSDGYINITNPEDMYIIAGRDFADTYHVL